MKKRKAMKRLQARRADYDRMIVGTKRDYTGYHRPGSNNK